MSGIHHDPAFAQLRLRDDEEFRTQILNWLRANGVKPEEVPAGVRATVTDGRLTIPVFVRDSEGHQIEDPSAPGTLATYTVTVPVVVPPSRDVELWLQPRCETCGR